MLNTFTGGDDSGVAFLSHKLVLLAAAVYLAYLLFHLAQFTQRLEREKKVKDVAG